MKNFNKCLTESIQLHNSLLNDKALCEKIENICTLLARTFMSGNKILIAGNGGSASDSQHFAGEIVGRFKLERRGYPAICLNTDTSVMTAWSNDYSFSTVFSRQIEALGTKGDVFFGISTSGNSENIVSAVKMAKLQEITTVCLLGKDGGALKDLCDFPVVVPSDNTARIQEIHILIIHSICEEVEKQFK